MSRRDGRSEARAERDFSWIGFLMDEHYAGDDTTVRLLARGNLAAYAGISVEDFQVSASRFLRSAEHPRLGRSYLECASTPMVELLDYLRPTPCLLYRIRRRTGLRQRSGLRRFTQCE